MGLKDLYFDALVGLKNMMNYVCLALNRKSQLLKIKTTKGEQEKGVNFLNRFLRL